MAKKKIKTEELDALVQELVELKDNKDLAKELSANAHNKYEAQRAKLLDTLRLADKERYDVKGLGMVRVTKKLDFITPKTIETKRAFADYIESAYGLETKDDMFSVNYNTLNSFCKKEYTRAEEDKNVSFTIPGIEDPTETERVSFYPEKKKAGE